MKTFPTAFAVEKNKKVGAKPIWILKVTLNSVDYYLTGKPLIIRSFESASPWPSSVNVITKGVVKSWGAIHQGITNWLSEFQVSEFSVSLLLNDPEEGSTNIVLQSNNFTASPWTAIGTGTRVQGASDPFGGISAWTINDTSNSAYYYITQSVTVVPLTKYTLSCWIKKQSTLTNAAVIQIRNGSYINSIVFNPKTGAFVTQAGQHSFDYGAVVSDGDFWKVSLTFTSLIGETSKTIYFFPAVNTDGSPTPTITATGSQIIYNLQLEQKEYATADIFTSTTSVSRTPLALETLLLSYPIEDQPIELYEWFYGCTDPPQRLFHGYVRDVTNLTDLSVDLSIQDDTIKLESAYIGTKIASSSSDSGETNTSVFPTADPDDVGKVIPIIYGSVAKVPPVCVKAGVATTLKYAVDDATTVFWLSDMNQDGDVNYVGMVFLVDYEFVVCTDFTTGYDNNTITVVRSSILASGAVYRGTYSAAVSYDLGDVVVYGTEGFQYQSIYANNLNNTPDYKQNNQYWSFVSAVSHQQGAVIYQWSYTDPLVWLFDCPLDSMSTVYSRIDNTDVDITHLTTKYLGTTGNQLTDYPGRAAITITNVPVVSKAVAIDYQNELSVSQGSHQHPASTSYTNVSLDSWQYTSGPEGQTGNVYSPASNWTSSYGGPQNLYDGNNYSFAYLGLGGNNAYGYVVRIRRAASTGSGTPVNVRGVFVIRRNSGGSGYYRLVVGGTAYSWTAFGATTDSAPVTIQSGWYSLTAWSTLYADNTYIEVYIPWTYVYAQSLSFKGVWNSGTTYTLYDVVRYGNDDYRSIMYNNTNHTPTTTAWWTQISGSSNLLYEASYEVETGAASTYAAAAGVQLQGSLSLSGNSVADIRIGKLLVDCNRTITNEDICDDLISRTGQSITVSNVGSPTGYTLSGVITEYQTSLWWLNKLAIQMQAWFAIVNGSARLIYRPRSTVDKVISACKIGEDGVRSLTRKKTDITEVINKINLLYNRDLSIEKSESSYKLNRLVQDSTSQSIYSLREQSSTFQFDFITLVADAVALSSFYLTNYKDRHWLAEFDVYLDHSELEFGDYVQLGFLNNVYGTVLASSHTPGSYSQIDLIHLTVLIL